MQQRCSSRERRDGCGARSSGPRWRSLPRDKPDVYNHPARKHLPRGALAAVLSGDSNRGNSELFHSIHLGAPACRMLRQVKDTVSVLGWPAIWHLFLGSACSSRHSWVLLSYLLLDTGASPLQLWALAAGPAALDVPGVLLHIPMALWHQTAQQPRKETSKDHAIGNAARRACAGCPQQLRSALLNTRQPLFDSQCIGSLPPANCNCRHLDRHPIAD